MSFYQLRILILLYTYIKIHLPIKQKATHTFIYPNPFRKHWRMKRAELEAQYLWGLTLRTTNHQISKPNIILSKCTEIITQKYFLSFGTTEEIGARQASGHCQGGHYKISHEANSAFQNGMWPVFQNVVEKATLQLSLKEIIGNTLQAGMHRFLKTGIDILKRLKNHYHGAY